MASRQLRRSVGQRASAIVLASLALVASSMAFGGCFIEERPLDPALAKCDTYCQRVTTACAGTSRVYTDEAQCRAVCAQLPSGVQGETPGSNTVQCRLELLDQQDFEPNDCPFVGPLGGGQCGNDCDAYCGLRRAACVAADGSNSELEGDYCERHCPAIEGRRLGSKDIEQDADTLQCRAGFLMQALANPDDDDGTALNCSRSRIVPDIPRAVCLDPQDTPREDDCTAYCSLIAAACTGPYQLYDDDAQCQAACLTFRVGTPTDTGANTLRCRRYHAYNALGKPEEHCTHAGPAGDGTCADPNDVNAGNCESYCTILADACIDQYDAKFPSGLQACIAECSVLDGARAGSLSGTNHYTSSVEQPPGGLKCRLQHAVRALTDKNGPECGPALGNGACAAEPTSSPQ